MKRTMFLLASLSYCLASYAAEPAKTVQRGQLSRALKARQPQRVVLHNKKSPGYCMGLAGVRTQPRTLVKQGKCNGQPDQTWILEPTNEGSPSEPVATIHNAKSRMCLGVDRGRRDPGADLRQNRCNGNPDQKWAFQLSGEGQDEVVRIKHFDNLCIGVAGGSTTRAQLKQGKCRRDAKDQFWN